jgi:protein-S-isoprenylcysteine O-methyltransferase Ste14
MSGQSGVDTGRRAPGARARLWVVVQIPLEAATVAVPVIQVLIGHTSGWPEAILWPARLVGAALVVAAFLTFRAAARALGPDLVATPRPSAGSYLRETGIYGRVRHPIYVAVIVGATGWALLWSSTVGLILTAICLAFLVLKARYEESLLLARFPAYAAYRRRVPAFVPRSLGLKSDGHGTT